MDPKKVRATAKSQVSKVATFLEKEGATSSAVKLKVKLEILEKYYAEFCKAQTEIDSTTTDAAMPAEESAREEFDDLYCDIKSSLLERIDALTVSSASTLHTNTSGSTCAGHHQPPPQHAFKLPTIELKPFSGNYLEWAPFKDMFNSMIETIPNLLDVNKLFYLKNALEGEPLQMINAMPLIDANFSLAWEKLNDRFANKGLVIKAHLSEIFSLPQCDGTSRSLKKVLDTVTSNVRSLENLGLEGASLSDAMLFHIVTSKLDERSKELFNESRSQDDVSDYERLLKFLTNRVNSLADLPPGKDLQNNPPPPPSKYRNQKSQEKRNVQVHQNGVIPPNSSTIQVQQNGIIPPSPPSFTSAGLPPCPDCAGINHPLYRCVLFQRRSPSERYEILKNAKTSVCFNCFRPGHTAMKCQDQNSCKHCGRKHHSLLHQPYVKPIDKKDDTKDGETSAPKVDVLTITQLSTTQVLLATASLLIKDNSGRYQRVRAFLDPGAQANLVTKSLVKRLKLPLKRTAITITGVGNIKNKADQIAQCEIASRVSDYKSSLHAVIVQQICSNLPSQPVATAKLPLDNKELADPQFDQPGPVELLLCGEFYLDLLTDGRVAETAETPSMHNTVFGWIVGGKALIATSHSDKHEVLINHCAISESLERFWSVEDVDCNENSATIEEKACEAHYVENVARLPDGRFEVGLPLKAQPKVLGDSREIAAKILKYTQARLSPEHKREYKAFMDEYIQLGHMVPIAKVDLTVPHAYLPHHPVFKDTSATTKLRVVFNGAKPTTSGVSVNDIHMKGPVIQQDLFSILVRFRLRKIALCTDVEKMYRQIRVRGNDWDLQRIVWYDDEHNLADFHLTTVTYGLTSSSFLAVRSLIQLARASGTEFPIASAVFENDFYIDDGITGAATIAEAAELVRQMNGLAAKGQFTLRKWVSNCPAVLEGLEQRNSDVAFLLNSDEKVGTLGISWLPSADQFVLFVTLCAEPSFNKRSILSEISKIFDPLGLATPVVVTFKLFLRELWKKGCNWDEPLDPASCDKWKLYRQSIMSLRLECPRLVFPGSSHSFEIHGFCDASTQAYCACLYVRCRVGDSYQATLLCSKSRVAPLQVQHIHRLELMGATLLAKLLLKVKQVLFMPPSNIHLWCDSQVSLAWLKKDPKTLKTFVGNRVDQVQKLVPGHPWHYVHTSDNPADIGSRGVTGEKLAESILWWNGPAFLTADPLPFDEAYVEPPEVSSELKKPKVKVLAVNLAEEFDLFHRYESANKLIRSIAWWLRFMRNARVPNKNERQSGSLVASELAAAKIVLVKLAQSEYDVEKLRKKGTVNRRSKLRSLAPFLDNNGVIRVGGRLKNAVIPENKRHPMIMDAKHPFAEALVREMHKNWCHPPVNLALALLREEYWLIGAKALVKKITNDCATCIKARCKFMTQQMGQLPPDRVNPGFPFQKVGIDYAGPVEVVLPGGRRRSAQKGYIALFVCLATKALHLEIVTALTSNAFLDALSRFVARRGKPSLIRSDNGTNFRGAYNDLIRITQSHPIQSASAELGFEWEFNPPSAPHFGGIWEAGVKSVKNFLSRMDHRFDYEEWATTLAKIEGFLNSRPLGPLSEDAKDLEALTPGHFLIGRSLQALPELDQTDSKNNQDRFIIRQRVLQQFWRQWQRDYLNQLQQRPKWMQPKPDIAPEQIVLLREVTSPQTWLLGRVVKTYPGVDGHIRVVDVRTKKGIVKRPITKIVPL